MSRIVSWGFRLLPTQPPLHVLHVLHGSIPARSQPSLHGYHSYPTLIYPSSLHPSSTLRAGFLARPFAHVETGTSSSQFVHSILVSVSILVFLGLLFFRGCCRCGTAPQSHTPSINSLSNEVFVYSLKHTKVHGAPYFQAFHDFFTMQIFGPLNVLQNVSRTSLARVREFFLIFLFSLRGLSL